MKFQGYLFAALAAATYGTNPIFAKPLYAAGMNTDSVLLFRYLIAIAMMWLLLLWRCHSLKRTLQVCKVRRADLPQLFVMGLLMSASSILLFVSYNYMPVGIASTLLFIYPILVALIMTVCFREHLSWTIVSCLVLASTGIALLCKSDNAGGYGLSDSFLIGFLCVMASSLSYAIYLVGLNKSRLRSIPSLTATFWVLLFGSLIYVVRIGSGIPLTMPTTPMMWFCCAGLGLFPTVISLVFTAQAIQRIGSTQTALLGALEPVTAVSLGILLLGGPLTWVEFTGMCLIFLSVSVVIKSRQ